MLRFFHASSGPGTMDSLRPQYQGTRYYSTLTIKEINDKLSEVFIRSEKR
jgi:hypothetical protein